MTCLQQKKASHRVPWLLSLGMLLAVLLMASACASVPAGTGTGFTFNKTPTTGGVGGGATAIVPGKGTGTTPPATTSPGTTLINATVTYASVKTTIVDVQQASSFADDSSTSASNPGAVRIDFNEETGAAQPSYAYGTVLRLILPDNTRIEPLNSKESTSPAASVSRKNWVDFSVPLTVNVKQLTLRFGTAAEAPIDIVLKPNSDVSQYQAKTATPNKQVQYKDQYSQTNWTLTTVSSQLSDDGQQATKGMVYVVVSLKIDNPSQGEFSGNPSAYMRLKAGDATSSLSNYTIPLSFAPGTSNATGTVSFLVPQGNTSFTFVLLATGTAQEATIPFQIS
ncbi:MAG: hypothetical protein ABI234_20255 [Ktedonobacteraceae bacterium]